MDAGKRIIDGRYRLDEVIGSGGMGIVWRAFDQKLGRAVAVKEVRFPASITADERANLTQRALIEAQSAGQLDHPNIVAMYDVVDADNRPYLVMRLIEGASLEELIEADGPLDPISTAAIGVALVDALAAAHAANIVHRDVKPQNVLIQRDGTPLLTDFSIASVFGSGTLTGTGILLGSPGYIAPERLLSGETGPAGDLFGLGATLFHAAEGIGPFASDEPLTGLFATASRPHPRPRRAGPVLAPILDGLLAKDPAERLNAPRARILLQALADSRGQATRLSRPKRQVVPPTVDAPRVQGDPPSESPTRRFATPTGPPAQQPAATWQPWEWQAAPEVAPRGAPAPAGGPPPASGPPPGRPPAGGPPPGRPPAGGPPPGRPPAGGPPPGRRGRRRHLVLAAAAVLALIVGTGVGVSVVASQSNDPAATTSGRSPSPSRSSSPVVPAAGTAPAADPKVLASHITLSISDYTGGCAAKIPFTIAVTITVSKVPASVRYSVHATSGKISDTEFTVVLSSSKTYKTTLYRWHQDAPIGPLGYYLTISSPSRATTNTAYLNNRCVSASATP